jgi:hypothetical protein
MELIGCAVLMLFLCFLLDPSGFGGKIGRMILAIKQELKKETND